MDLEYIKINTFTVFITQIFIFYKIIDNTLLRSVRKVETK